MRVEQIHIPPRRVFVFASAAFNLIRLPKLLQPAMRETCLRSPARRRRMATPNAYVNI